MKTLNIVIFFTVFFAIYGVVNYYLYVRGLQALPADTPWRSWYTPLVVFLALSFIAGRFLERAWLSPVSSALVWIGSYWLAAMLYFLLAVLLLDLLRGAHALIPFFPEWITSQYERVKLLTAISIVGVVAVVLIVGSINACQPRTRALEMTLHKEANGGNPLRIVMASDIHLGTIIGQGRFDRIVATINALEPDLVLFPGDLVDEDLTPVIRQNLGESLRAVRAKLGVFAATGNHEYIGGVEEACAYLQEHGITVLRDSLVRLENGLQIIGREDRSIRQFTGKERKSLEELMRTADRNAPIILMDHQPIGLDEAERNGVDIQLSGHTHHGQLWPFNHVTEAIYELSWGYLQREETHFIVSTGVGTWGPPVRTGNRPEVVILTVRFSS